MANQPHVLTIKGDTFNALSSDFDSVLRDTLSTMEHKGSDSGKVTVTVDISLDMDTAPDYNAKHEATRQITKPTFKHKVASMIQLKDERTGKLGGDFELRWNPDIQKYELVPLSSTYGQSTLFEEHAPEHDAEYDPVPGNELEGRPEQALLPESTVAAPAPVDNVLDVDFTEVTDDDPAAAGDDEANAELAVGDDE